MPSAYVGKSSVIKEAWARRSMSNHSPTVPSAQYVGKSSVIEEAWCGRVCWPIVPSAQHIGKTSVIEDARRAVGTQYDWRLWPESIRPHWKVLKLRLELQREFSHIPPSSPVQKDVWNLSITHRTGRSPIQLPVCNVKPGIGISSFSQKYVRNAKINW